MLFRYKEQIGKAAKGYDIGQYLNISLYKQITRNGQVGEPEQISKISRSITISLQVPKNLLNTDSFVTRTFWIIRNYRGQAEFLPTTYDGAKNTLTFETDKFSDYAIVYKDTRRTGDKGDGDNNNGTGNTGTGNTGNNNTGNNTNGTGTGNAGTGNTGNNSSAPLNTATGTVPKTGDGSNLWLWFALLFISCTGVVMAVFYGRRKKKETE